MKREKADLDFLPVVGLCSLCTAHGREGVRSKLFPIGHTAFLGTVRKMDSLQTKETARVRDEYSEESKEKKTWLRKWRKC